MDCGCVGVVKRRCTGTPTNLTPGQFTPDRDIYRVDVDVDPDTGMLRGMVFDREIEIPWFVGRASSTNTTAFDRSDDRLRNIGVSNVEVTGVPVICGVKFDIAGAAPAP